MNGLKDNLKLLYTNLDLLSDSPMNCCPNRSSCWNDLEEERKVNCDWGLYFPFIGNKYDKGRVLVLGINMNGFGDSDAEDILAEEAIEEILQGKKRTFAKPGYRGSLLWHRLLSYSAFILRENGNLPIPSNRLYPSKEELKAAIDYIAVTNSIKCAPSMKNSEPSYQMWRNCPQFLLKEEINILKPSFIVVLGVWNYSWVKSLFRLEKEVEIGKVKLSIMNNKKQTIAVFGIPHPSSSQGTSISRMDELEQLLIEHFTAI